MMSTTAQAWAPKEGAQQSRRLDVMGHYQNARRLRDSDPKAHSGAAHAVVSDVSSQENRTHPVIPRS